VDASDLGWCSYCVASKAVLSYDGKVLCQPCYEGHYAAWHQTTAEAAVPRKGIVWGWQWKDVAGRLIGGVIVLSVMISAHCKAKADCRERGGVPIKNGKSIECWGVPRDNGEP
jgi:hypothetical protein